MNVQKRNIQEKMVQKANIQQETTLKKWKAICCLLLLIIFCIKIHSNLSIYADEDQNTKWRGIASPSVSGALQVKGTQLCDCYGNPVQLRGLSTHGIAWFPEYINEACFSELRNNWNINVIRLAFYTAEYGGYCTGGDQEALKAQIRKGVEYAVKQDLYVLIDWHILSDGNPNLYKEQAKAFFAEISAEYAECPNVLYEICNEPNGQVSWAEIKAYAEEIIAVIRKNDSDGIILVGTPNWSQYVDQAAADPIVGNKNLMYTLHFYAATHQQDLRNTMVETVRAGLPLFVTEFGICEASGSGVIDTIQAEQWLETMDNWNISYIAWNLSNKEETSAILQSGCQKKYGFQKEDLSDTGKWLYTAFTKQKEPLSYTEDQKKPEILTPLLYSKETNKEFEYEMIQYANWEANGRFYYQYGVKVKNISETECNNWQISIPFSQNIILENGWNGNGTTEGSVLYLTSKEYNGTIAGKGIVDGIGFIISSEKETILQN